VEPRKAIFQNTKLGKQAGSTVPEVRYVQYGLKVKVAVLRHRNAAKIVPDPTCDCVFLKFVINLTLYFGGLD
jgi:hypothetical protein